MSIGRFIIECDPEYFDDAIVAANQMLDSDDKEMMSSATYSDGTEVLMFVKRLKKSIRIQQVKP